MGETPIHIWEVDYDVLLAQTGTPPVSYTSAKIVLVGDSGVGKTGLGWRLAHGEFEEHASTHGQQFWVLDRLTAHRRDGTECEAVLWDLAGQQDYRLITAWDGNELKSLAGTMLPPRGGDVLLYAVSISCGCINRRAPQVMPYIVPTC